MISMRAIGRGERWKSLRLFGPWNGNASEASAMGARQNQDFHGLPLLNNLPHFQNQQYINSYKIFFPQFAYILKLEPENLYHTIYEFVKLQLKEHFY